MSTVIRYTRTDRAAFVSIWRLRRVDQTGSAWVGGTKYRHTTAIKWSSRIACLLSAERVGGSRMGRGEFSGVYSECVVSLHLNMGVLGFVFGGWDA